MKDGRRTKFNVRMNGLRLKWVKVPFPVSIWVNNRV